MNPRDESYSKLAFALSGTSLIRRFYSQHTNPTYPKVPGLSTNNSCSVRMPFIISSRTAHAVLGHNWRSAVRTGPLSRPDVVMILFFLETCQWGPSPYFPRGSRVTFPACDSLRIRKAFLIRFSGDNCSLVYPANSLMQAS